MRIVFQNGKQVGTDPINHYVYLSPPGEIDCYVGKGVKGRWLAHTRPNRDNPNDRNEPKSRYFLAHSSEMTCYIIAEALRTGEANERETVEIRRRGYAADRTGTLLNAKRDGSIARAARKPAGSREKHLRQKRLASENAYAKARARSCHSRKSPPPAPACSQLAAGEDRPRALSFGTGPPYPGEVMRKADDKLYDGDVFYIARAFFFRADLVGLAVEEDGESLLVREATAAEKDNAIRFSAYLTGRPTAAIARISGFAGEVPEPDPPPAAPDALPEPPIERGDTRTNTSRTLSRSARRTRRRDGEAAARQEHVAPSISESRASSEPLLSAIAWRGISARLGEGR